MFFSHYIKKCFGPRNVSDEINGFITTVELFSLTKPDLEDLFLPRSENKVTFEELRTVTMKPDGLKHRLKATYI